jgi:hypothetical protein
MTTDSKNDLTPEQLARRARKAETRKAYDAKRRRSHYMLALHIPKGWKEAGLGPVLRKLMATLVAEELSSKKKKSLVKLLNAEITRRTGGPGRECA